MRNATESTRRETRWLVLVAAALIIASALAYVLHYLIFRDAHHIFIYMLHDIAFVPLEVILTVIIIDRLLARRAKAGLQQKLNMVIGAFFSEIGNRLLEKLTPSLVESEAIAEHLNVRSNWTTQQFASAEAFARTFSYEIDKDKVDLDELKREMAASRDFLVRLLENPTLLEHDTFTDMLWAIFHLTEELESRPSLAELPKADRAHLALDIKRAYERVAAQWIAHAEHLKKSYPYLFSLVVRTHPFQSTPSPIVTE